MTTIYQRSEFHLTRLLVEISSLVSRKQPDPDTLQRFAHLIAGRLGSSRTEIHVPILGARGIAGPAEDGRSPFVVFSRRVAVRRASCLRGLEPSAAAERFGRDRASSRRRPASQCPRRIL